ncbi:four-helix bundle copper-binding protein [Bradyrhizobium sp. 83002]|uniref:four-helix bundle copper-binding protein n=1 Tax=Bradyrhizobium aeschynomenes TaxID=2734909 RepID=UPI0015539BF9|nr:four-helix bundle copper-binding protein [Bradyrhizobium aeschynomenes]NPU13481.1 four-helix bundle copper-binding protein [Bradyrhizobium aeschynomenes]NPV19986.1 four-helix bundle copper-binding protein [Bradyrhizobium aeschynomenes]
MHAQQMIETHPHVRGRVDDALVRCIEECYSCAQTCTSCADACLAEDNVAELTQCIRLNLDCADVCTITGRMATRRTGSDQEMIRRMLDACAAACRFCAEECEKHARMHAHCRICAESCRRCLSACEEAGRSMAH